MSNTIQFIGTSPADLITELKNSLIPELTAIFSGFDNSTCFLGVG